MCACVSTWVSVRRSKVQPLWGGLSFLYQLPHTSLHTHTRTHYYTNGQLQTCAEGRRDPLLGAGTAFSLFLKVDKAIIVNSPGLPSRHGQTPDWTSPGPPDQYAIITLVLCNKSPATLLPCAAAVAIECCPVAFFSSLFYFREGEKKQGVGKSGEIEWPMLDP